MARTKTLLNGVNDVLKRVGVIQGQSGEFAALTSTNRQQSIDVAVQVWNETIDEAFSKTNQPLSRETTTREIVLANGVREYKLPSNFVTMRWPLIDSTNTQFISEYPGGYDQLRTDISLQNDPTGLPMAGAINTSNSLLSLDRTPTSVEAGRSYELFYDRDTVMTEATDLFPFDDIVYRSMVPAVAHNWREAKQKPFDAGARKKAMARAMRYLRQAQPIESWTPTRPASAVENSTDPFER
jgi:hypothetical protein